MWHLVDRCPRGLGWFGLNDRYMPEGHAISSYFANGVAVSDIGSIGGMLFIVLTSLAGLRHRFVS